MAANAMQKADELNSQLAGPKTEKSEAMDLLNAAVKSYYDGNPAVATDLRNVTPALAAQVLALASGPHRGTLQSVRLDQFRETAVGLKKAMDAVRTSMQRHVTETAVCSDADVYEKIVTPVVMEEVAAGRGLASCERRPHTRGRRR